MIGCTLICYLLMIFITGRLLIIITCGVGMFGFLNSMLRTRCCSSLTLTILAVLSLIHRHTDGCRCVTCSPVQEYRLQSVGGSYETEGYKLGDGNIHSKLGAIVCLCAMFCVTANMCALGL